MSDLRQVGMHELDRDRALADTGSHAFDGAVPNVTHRENTGDTSFQQERIPLEGPAIRAFSLPDQVRPCQDKSTNVPLYKAIEPIRAGRGADKNVERAGRHPVYGSGADAGNRDRFELILAVDRD